MYPKHTLSRRLQELPLFEPPPGGWADLQQRMSRARAQRRQAYTSFALAASVFAAVGLAFLQPIGLPEAEPLRPDPEVAQLMAQSQRLEQNLTALKPQVVVWDGRLAAISDNLESELAVVDLQLNYARPESARRLWRNRVALMSHLVQTHQQATLQPASYTVSQEQSL